MERTFEILKHPEKGCLAIKRGFSWPGFFFSWIWAFAKRLLLIGIVLLLVGIALLVVLSLVNPILALLLGLSFNLLIGFKGNSWRSRSAEKEGYLYVGVLSASSPESAISKFLKGDVSSRRSGFVLPVPGVFQKIFAIVSLTWKAAFRYRLFWILSVLLLGTVVALPVIIKDDGTARGFTQILLTYTLGVIATLLGLSTLWLSCGTLARDIEDAQIQMVVVKPIRRWQIWIGKWIGLVLLDAALLAIAAGAVFFLLQWRATKLPEAEQRILRNEIFVARGSLKPPRPDLAAAVVPAVQQKLKENPALNVKELASQLLEQAKAEAQGVSPGYGRAWVFDLGFTKEFLRDQPLFLRIKFNSPETRPFGDPPTYRGLMFVGVPGTTKFHRIEEPSLAAETVHEFVLQPNLFDENGRLTVEFQNFNNVGLVFSLDEGIEILYREGGFALNYIRGCGIVLCWLALLAAIGLCAASFLSFPVAAFFALTVLFIGFSSGTLSTVVEEKTILGQAAQQGTPIAPWLDALVVPIFAAVLKVVNLVQGFSPIDLLSNGRSITWAQLGLAISQIVLLLGGIFAVMGILIFERRELARPQINA